jgi:integrase
MIKPVYSNRARPGWQCREGGWPDDRHHRKYKSWGFDIHFRDVQGIEHRKKESGFATKSDAQEAAGNFAHAVLRSRYGIREVLPMPTLAQLVAKHLPQISSRNEQKRATRVLNELLAACGKSLLVGELHSSDLLKLVERMQRQQHKPATIDRNLNIVSSMLNSGRTYFPALSQWLAPKIPRPKYSQRRRERTIKLEEITKLLTYLYRDQEPGESDIAVRKRRNVAHVFRMALLTASRKGEIRRLRWDQIDWQAGTFQLIGTKTENSQAHTARYPKITDTIAAIFRERWIAQGKGELPWPRVLIKSSAMMTTPIMSVIPAPTEKAQSESSTLLSAVNNTNESSCWKSLPKFSKNQSRYVFTSNGGEVTHYYEIIANAARACGLLYGRNTLGGFVTHDTRHTAVSYLLGLGYDLKTIGEITGHTDETLVLLYSHVSPKIVSAAYDDLEKFAGTGTLGMK